MAKALAKSSPHWSHFAHDADIGVIGIGPSKSEAFRQGALALTGVVTDPGRVNPRERVAIACEAPNDEFLFVEWLNALIYEMAVRGMLFGDFAVEIEGATLRADDESNDIDEQAPVTIIGVVENSRFRSIRDPIEPMIYQDATYCFSVPHDSRAA